MGRINRGALATPTTVAGKGNVEKKEEIEKEKKTEKVNRREEERSRVREEKEYNRYNCHMLLFRVEKYRMEELRKEKREIKEKR